MIKKSINYKLIWNWVTEIYCFLSDSIDGNMTDASVRNEAGLIHSSNKNEHTKAGLAFFIAGFIALTLGILTLIILSRIL